MQDPRLTPTSYIVLGLLETVGEGTPYDLKRMVAFSIGNFWSLPHAQLYTEPERLAKAGLLTERREEGGRRRRLYSLTDRGKAALREWRKTPTSELSELRDPALLQLFLGADPQALAAVQVPAHEEKLAEYQALAAEDPGRGPRGPWLALEAGIAHARVWIRFWRGLSGQADDGKRRRPRGRPRS